MRTIGAIHPGSADRVGVTRVYGYPGEGVNGLAAWQIARESFQDNVEEFIAR